MWFLFLIFFLILVLAGLFIVWIGSKVFHSIDKKEKENKDSNKVEKEKDYDR